MKKGILLIFCMAIFATAIAQKKPNNFKSWSIGAYGGTNWQVGSELTSLSDPNAKFFNYMVTADVTKYISHAVGFVARFDIGNAYGNAPYGEQWMSNETDFQMYSLGTELKLSSLFRRQDRAKLRYRWGFLANTGFGITSYKATRYLNGEFDETANPNPFESTGEGKSIFRTLYWYVGTEVRFNVNQSFDIGFKPTFVFTTDGQFDNCGGIGAACPIEQNVGENNDNLIGLELGVRYKIGKKGEEHLEWVVPNYDQSPKLVDTDGDGVADIFDVEPDTPQGAKVYGDGSSIDIDNDGLPDYNDECPTVAGVPELNGCPPRGDKDGDGIFDDEDDCPNTPGVPERAGCPELDYSVLAALADRIFFDTGKYTIKPQSYQDLDEIANILNAAPDTNWFVDGHTDSTGNYAKNMTLSQNRAQAVVDALVQRGINPSRLQSRGFGPDRPRDTNDTAAGRQMNRRVEFKENK